MAFNENTRVKIPALLHLTRLGYEYVSLSHAVRDEDTNIFTEIFAASVERLNPGEGIESARIAAELKELLDYEDLGKAFYKRLVSDAGVKLIDFADFSKNSFHVCTELTCKNGDDEFRPDITILINGIPLVFIEVKKPNNRDGILAERNRINARFQNRKFRRFLNATQFMIFSNNMEYDHESIVPIQGAFYASISVTEAVFNCFREEDETIFDRIGEIDERVENFILKDNGLAAIKHADEYVTNKSPMKPTNRIITSLLSPDRLKTILKYGLAYVEAAEGLQKHVMRYPQFFATQAIERAIGNGVKKGIIWHTQGSGKTALAYFNVAYMTACFQRKNIVPKFYFIVDRIDLMMQARDEFVSRGLHVNAVNSKEEFVTNIKTVGALLGKGGEAEITVVNIQKFSEESRVTSQDDYDINTQRIYFLDEVHRSYNPRGSFLANLFSSDKDAIFIGLTGTPLLGRKIKSTDGGKSVEYDSKDIFGDYIHKYYYNLSIEDGYTLKLIREGIETSYKLQLRDVLEQIELLRGSANKRIVYSHPKFVQHLAAYIINDFRQSKVRLGDDTIGGMIVCESSDQAKVIFDVIRELYPEISSALILHDVDDKETRKNNRDEFKLGNIDLLIVFNLSG